jgi:hypothetical protein
MISGDSCRPLMTACQFDDPFDGPAWVWATIDKIADEHDPPPVEVGQFPQPV